MEFKSVKVIKKANVYFGGKVDSRTIIFEDGSRKTLGFMQKGEYEFNTGAPELMEVIGGEMLIKRAEDKDFISIKEGESFSVEKDSSFKVKVNEYADYCCSYK
ncbi:pyrimidine/purine nucleoside phosphorylase [Cetobacterium sp.]|uniref:pyrimidine/purine nucleoside phosphorylase n=1 Tax=Cetobacterium sp. TaxID=2071632 RepID=UPI003AF0CA5F